MRRTRIELLIVTLMLASFGVVMVYSSSAIYAYQIFGDSLYFLKRELLYFLIGTLGMIYLMNTDYSKVAKYSPTILACSMVLLILVFTPQFGRVAGGARRWFKIWTFSFQPSELAKLALILYLSDFLSRRQAVVKSFFRGFLPPLLISAVIVGLILFQPDLGTAMLIAILAFTIFFVSGIRLLYIFPVVASFFPLFYLLIKRSPYRMKRIMAYLNPWQDPRGSGFQIIQSFLALGSGGLFGLGLGQSRQKLLYLPHSHTDFIFSIIGEELGLIGTLSVLILFGLFVWLGAKVALKSPDLLGGLLSLGVVLMIGLQAVIHVGVATGSIPTKGLPLPFISYGGSSLIFNLMGVGLLLNVAKQ